ncbi:MAG: VOC family protein [Alphaproteobacteria bacterium]|jgi:lactoylglutathione lyase|nr:VOC family protein [Alphaproteobacteria bacterium]
MAKKVTGIGGIFFKSANAEKSKEWYEKHLGIPVGEYGHIFQWRDMEDTKTIGQTVWFISKDGDSFKGKNEQPYMINYRVENLEELLENLKSEGIEIIDGIEEYPYGKFAHILDLDGNKLELWEPIGEKEDNK